MTLKLSKAIASLTGLVFSIGGVTGGADVYVPIAEITSIKPSGRKRDVVKAANADSGGFKTTLGTIMDGGQIAVTCNYVPTDPGQQAVIAAALVASSYDFKMQFPINAKVGQLATGNSFAGAAVVSECNLPDPSLDKYDEFTFTLEVDGDWTPTAGA